MSTMSLSKDSKDSSNIRGSTATLVASKDSISTPYSNENLASHSRPTSASPTNSQSVNPAGGLVLIKIVDVRLFLDQLPSSAKFEDGKLPYAVIEFDKNEAVVPAKEYGRERGVIYWQQKTHL
jgi:hypothetical protein